MADYWTQGSFAFCCHQSEQKLLSEAFAAAQHLAERTDAGAPSAALLAAFPPTQPGDCWSGFRAIFPDPDYPEFGASCRWAQAAADPARAEVTIFGEQVFQPEPIAALIQRCCLESLAAAPIGFEWADSCSRPRVDAFGGGWCAIFADRIEFETTGEALSAALAGGIV